MFAGKGLAGTGLAGKGTAEAKLLVVDDEPNIRELLSATLRLAGFEVVAAADGAEAVQLAERVRPDLVVLDVMLPDIDGFSVANRLRANDRRIPVVFLTARDTTDDKITGLSVGDDYVAKPFSLEELLARIRAVLRRTRDDFDAPARFQVADLELDEDSHQVWRAGDPVELSPTEFRLLHYLMLNSGRVLSKGQILAQVWSHDPGNDGRVVEAYVSYLRRKVDYVDPRLIHTLRGVGYVLRAPRQ